MLGSIASGVGNAVRFGLHNQRHVDMTLVVETESDCVANTAGDGAKHGSCGMVGGADSAPPRYTLRSKRRAPRVLKTKEEGIPVRAGDSFHIQSAGGLDMEAVSSAHWNALFFSF